MDIKLFAGGVLLFIAVAVLAFFMPLVGIWSLNTLFALGIEYTMRTWVAMCFIMLVLTVSKK